MQHTPSFPPKRIIIYSVGLLGGSLGLGLKKSGFDGTIIGLSSLPAIETALRLGCIDEGYPYDQLENLIQSCDALFLCSPITVITQTIQQLATMKLPEGLIITDVGSTKKIITQIAREALPPHVHFIGGHPMAGSEKSGPSASDPYLFQNALYVLTPFSKQPDETEQSFAQFLKTNLGCRQIFLDPATHDTIAAMVSHIPHLVAVALVNLAQQCEDRIPGTMQLAAGGFRDLTRIASSPYKMWHDIFLTNKNAIGPLLDQSISLLTGMKKDLEADNLENAFTTASTTRNKIPIHNKGFLSPLHEILVIAQDRPGIIASISTTLADQSINIKDIEVIKIREGEGGTIRLAFDSEEIALTAIQVLSKHGFSAWERK